MRALFYHTATHWSGSARAFAVAARGLATEGATVAVVSRAGAAPEKVFQQEGLEIVSIPASDSVSRDAWRLRTVLKEKFIEVVFLHSEREHLAASSAMRL